MPDVLRFGDIEATELISFLRNYPLEIETVAVDQPIPGSFWGDEEAGLIKNKLYLRADTPVHSVLHECCHYICMDANRRSRLNTNAGGTNDEENAVCYLQVLIADEISGLGKARLFSDMDIWGYSFRLGSTQAWFDNDAEDAKSWLIIKGLIDQALKPTFKMR